MEGMYNLLVKTYYMLMKHKYGAAPTNTMFFAVLSPYSILKKYSVLNGLPSASTFNPLNAELNPICYLLALLAHHFLHGSRIRVKSLTLRLLMSYIYGAPILDASRSHTTHHSR